MAHFPSCGHSKLKPFMTAILSHALSGWGDEKFKRRREEKRAWHLARYYSQALAFPRTQASDSALQSACLVGSKGGKEKRAKKIHGLPLGIEPRTTSRASAARHGIAATAGQVTRRGKQPILTCQETGAMPETIQQVYSPKNRARPPPRWCSSVVRASD